LDIYALAGKHMAVRRFSRLDTVTRLDEFGRVRLSQNFFMREFLHSEICQMEGVPNIPDNPRLAIEAGSMLCEIILEPLQATFGRVSIRSGYRSSHLNAIGAEKRHNCTRNDKNYARHIWDRLDDDGCMGAMACVVLPWFTDRYDKGADWRSLAWWIHDHLDYSELVFYPKLCAFNIGWHQKPKRTIKSHVAPLGYMVAPGQWADIGNVEWYRDFPAFDACDGCSASR
jgi:hypothetical protein